MKIAFISRYLPSGSKGGVGYQTHFLANIMCDKGHEITVYSLCAKPQDAKYGVKQIKLNRIINKIDFLRTHFFPIYLINQDWYEYDIIHSQGDCQFIFTETPLLRTFNGSAFCEATHSKSLYGFIRQISLYPFEILSSFKATYKVAISRNTKKFIPLINDIVPCFINLNEFTNTSETIKSKNPSILFVGTLYGRKRGSLLVDIFENYIQKKIPDAELWMVCEGESNNKNIKFFGRVTQEKLVRLYCESWVFCLPSSYEGFGVPYIEAMAGKSAIVATWNMGAEEVLEQGRYGIISTETDLGKNIVSIIKDRKRREILCESSFKHISKYSIDNISNLYENKYFQLCKGVNK